MTLRAWNSFQYHAKGWTGGAGVTRDAGVGQSGLPGFEMGTAQGGTYGYSAMTHVIHGFCYEAGNTVVDQRILAMTDDGVSSPDFELRIGTGGAVVALRANGTVELGRSASGVIQQDVPVYLEVRVLASTGAAGEVEVRLNGDPTPILDLAGQNTGAASFVDLKWYGQTNGETYSAWYFIEVDATAPNDFLGHIRFAPLDPTDNGNSSGLSGSDGNSVNNFELVDDGASSINHDSDTTYVYSSTVSTKDTYTMEDLPTPALSIIAVCPIVIAKKTDAGTRGLTPVVRSGGTDYDGTEVFLGTSYDAYPTLLLEDPDTATAWDEAGVNAMEVGIKVTT